MGESHIDDEVKHDDDDRSTCGDIDRVFLCVFLNSNIPMYIDRLVGRC